MDPESRAADAGGARDGDGGGFQGLGDLEIWRRGGLGNRATMRSSVADESRYCTTYLHCASYKASTVQPVKSSEQLHQEKPLRPLTTPKQDVMLWIKMQQSTPPISPFCPNKFGSSDYFIRHIFIYPLCPHPLPFYLPSTKLKHNQCSYPAPLCHGLPLFCCLNPVCLGGTWPPL